MYVVVPSVGNDQVVVSQDVCGRLSAPRPLLTFISNVELPLFPIPFLSHLKDWILNALLCSCLLNANEASRVLPHPGRSIINLPVYR